MKDRTLITTWRKKLFVIIFGTNTPAGRTFDVALMIFIIASVLAVMLESIEHIAQDYGATLNVLEWVFTIFFTLEYILRLWVVKKPMLYAKSFFGIIDLLSILPSYIALFLIGTQAEYLMVIRALRLLRIFRIFKLAHFFHESKQLANALKASLPKITVFFTFVMLLVTILGSTMYLIEAGVNKGFTSIPMGIYWAIVTLTTVGYGDIHPITPLGQAVAAFVMILGYSVIAVPTGIVSVEIARQGDAKAEDKSCEGCGLEDHEEDAKYCKRCGHQL